MPSRFDAIPDDVKAELQRLGLEPDEYLDLAAGGLAILWLKCLVAGKRFMNGEGHDDPLIDQLVRKILNAFMQTVGRGALKRRTRKEAVSILSDLTGIYREYRDGKIETQADLRQVVTEYFDAIDHRLFEYGFPLFAPTREDLSKLHGGPSQYAKHVLGEFANVHWKTIHNWDTVGIEPITPDPYGICVTHQEIRDFIEKHLDFESARDRRIGERATAWTQAAKAATAKAADLLDARLKADGTGIQTPERVEAAKSRTRAASRTRLAGRPRKARR